MNRKLLPSLIAFATIGAAHAADSVPMPTVYGKINVSLNKNDFESINTTTKQSEQTTDNWNLNSNASRLGFKGDLPISDSLKAIYKLEYEIITTADKEGDNGSDFKQRNTYVGLQSKDWGTLIAGRHDTPLKLAQESVDQFNDYYLGDMKNVLVGENRLNNIIMYTTPTFAGFSLTAGFAPGEGSGNNTGTTSAAQHDNNDNGLADKYSIALSYKLDTLYLALAQDKNIINTDVTRFVAQYGIGPVKLGALYQTAERTKKYDTIGTVSSDGGFDLIPTGNFKEQDAFLLSAAWDINKEWTVKGQYVQSESTPTTAGLDDTEAKMYELGVDWKLSKSSTVFAYYSAIDTEGDNSISSDSTTDNTVGVGYELKF
ncbi:MAG: porin [Spongiibacteraceae bacterium]